jgi:hypothetical protein
VRCLAAALLLAGVADPALEVVSTRALDDADRTSLMIVVRNRTDRPVEIRDLTLRGAPIAEHLAPSDPKNPRSPGRGVDWYDVRPRRVPPRGAAAILLGYAARELREPALDLRAVTDAGEVDLGGPPPRPETLRVACAAFGADLRELTVFVRNDGARPASLGEVHFNGNLVSRPAPGPTVAPGRVAPVTFRTDVAFAQPCALVVQSDAGKATASFRAYPAESLNYPFYGQHADRRDLAEKNMDVYVTRAEASAQVAEEIERNGGAMPEPLEKSLARRAEQFGKTPGAWAWYMQDDAGWGRPRPQTLLALGRFLRERGSPQAQFLCNPADLRRYAWTHDLYMNYAYHVTGQSPDPAVFGGDRSLEEIRELNEPAPILYLVDSVGQSSRWITVAEEELASYAMLGRGARHLGWFLAPSVWDQGTTLHGGIDPLETRPWRYQEGATACVPVWTQIGNIAALTRALQPYLAASAPERGELRDDGVEVLPIVCKGDLLVVVLLNRRLRCTYPRDHADGGSHGGVRLKPHRNLTVRVTPLAGVEPAALAFDHDRGFRDAPVSADRGALEVTVDAVDTATVLLVGAPRETVRKETEARLRPPPGGSAVRPDIVLTPDRVTRRVWDDPANNYRADLAARGPLPAGAWVKAALPAEGGALGHFTPHSVRVFAQGRRLEAKVDHFKPIYRRAEGAQPWSLGKSDRHATLEPDPAGVRIVSRWKEPAYGIARLGTPLDPRYDVLEIRRELSGRLEPLLTYEGAKKGQVASLKRALEGAVWGLSELVERPGGKLPLSRIYWQRLTGGPVTSASLGAQVYSGVYRFGEFRQARSAPLVYVRLPRELKAGETFEARAYWHYAAYPPEDTPFLPEAERPRDLAEAKVGPLDAFGIAAVDEGGVTTEAQAECAWIEARDAAGRRTASETLRTSDGLRWTWGARPSGAAVRVVVAGAHGRVLALDLSGPAGTPRLAEIARVAGQVETLACSADGGRVVAGADRVYAFDRAGKPLWTFDLGENRRQPARYGPGRNVDRVEVRADGTVAASTFRFNEKSRQYENAVTVLLGKDGKETGRAEYDWKGKAGGKDPVPWPPYTLHKLPLQGGHFLAATTQGVVQRLAPDGKAVWEQRRPGRIDAARVLEGRGLVALAWKRYPHRYDWQCVPTLELVSLEDGATRFLAEGAAQDDFGHFGADLRLAASGDGSRLYLGDPSGRIYQLD